MTYIGLVLNRRGFDRAATGRLPGSQLCARRERCVLGTEPGNDHQAGDRGARRHRGRRSGSRNPLQRDDQRGLRLSVPGRGESPNACTGSIAHCAELGLFEIGIADTIGVAAPGEVAEMFAEAARLAPGRPASRAFPQHPEYRHRQRLRRGRGRSARARCQHRGNRRLPVRAGGDRKHTVRGSRLHVAPPRDRDRNRHRRAHRDRPLDRDPARPRRTRDGEPRGQFPAGRADGRRVHDARAPGDARRRTRGLVGLLREDRRPARRARP